MSLENECLSTNFVYKLVFLLMRILKSRTTSDLQKEHSNKDLMDTSSRYNFEIKRMQQHRIIKTCLETKE